MCFVFFFNDPAPTEIYTLSLPDALPIPSARSSRSRSSGCDSSSSAPATASTTWAGSGRQRGGRSSLRSEEHTSELQSRQYLVCRLLLEKKKTEHITNQT